MQNNLKLVLFGILLAFAFQGFSKNNKQKQEHKKSEEFDARNMIMHHVKDAHDFHLLDWNGHPITISLPVILWSGNQLVTFMSSNFNHDDSGKTVVEKRDKKFIKLYGKIYQLNKGETDFLFDSEQHPLNASKPVDISITRNVFMMWFSVIVLLLIFIAMAISYKKHKKNMPSGIAKFAEPLVLFVRDEIAMPMIGKHKYEKYMPYLLTIFFFIWINNIFGLMPILNGANLSGNIAFTFTLAVFTFVITTFSGNKNYWKHIFWMPGVPVPMKLFLAPIELIGVFIKPISLMIRLFANITAGHIIILALMSLIFVFKSIGIAPVSVAFSLFITLIEIIVTSIQAYIFTVLSALYFGMATEDH